MKQTSFASAEYAGKKRQARRERVLAELNAVVPWSRLEALIEPHYPKRMQPFRPVRRVAGARTLVMGRLPGLRAPLPCTVHVSGEAGT